MTEFLKFVKQVDVIQALVLRRSLKDCFAAAAGSQRLNKWLQFEACRSFSVQPEAIFHATYVYIARSSRMRSSSGGWVEKRLLRLLLCFVSGLTM